MDGEHELDGLKRRRFLQVLGASFAALGGCSRLPEQKIIPYVQQPEDATAGVANWYASTCAACPAACGTLVKSRDGRPIKIEGNPEHPLTLGGLCARGQASVLDLYDSERFQGPLVDGSPATWIAADAAVREELHGIAKDGGAIRILGSTTTSPSLLAATERFANAFPTARHVVYDALSSAAILDAHRLTHGERRLPWYRFDRAKVIVGFDADFLGTWIAPVEFTKAWRLNRRPGGDRDMSWHVQFEARMSVTGASADLRVPLRPSDELAVILDLARRVARQLERPEAVRLPGPPQKAVTATLLDRIAEQLTGNPERTLVVSGSRDGNVQLAVNALNEMLGNYGSTLDLARPSLQLQGDDTALGALIDEMEAGKVAALIVRDANPAHDHPRAADFRRALARVGLTVSLAGRRDETAALTKYVCPDHHALEAWGDAHPHIGLYTLQQPVIAPLCDTRAATESLLAWAGAREPAHDWLRSVWKTAVFPHQRRHTSFEKFWDQTLHDGVLPLETERLTVRPFDVRALSRIRAGGTPPPTQDGFEMVAYPSVALGDGRQANNPWLQELPDPVTKVTWGNYASVGPAAAKRLGVVEGRVVELRLGDLDVRLPVHVQPGMPDGVIAAAVGYGRTHAGRIAANYPIEKMFPIDKEHPGGADVYPFLGAPGVTLHVVDHIDALAKTQRYDFQADPVTGKPRHIARETTATAYAKDPAAGNEAPHGGPSLWPGHKYEGHRWAMAIDLGACTGCSACVIACQAENNVPVVGKAEVRKHRDMAWIRIDRYYGGDEEAPDVSFQPMLCQHCDNAPCETVCPALATLHSSEGLNMQVYNRCVGTRYCSNNCPYKVRRFNWFDYARDDPVQNLVLNPDVVVRTRGVMEKCSFCVQRIAAGKRHAKEEDRRPRDGEIAPACVQSCPADAIVFGDLNDPMSRIAALAEDPRSYRVLADLGVEPAVRYLTRVRNRKVSWRNP